MHCAIFKCLRVIGREDGAYLVQYVDDQGETHVVPSLKKLAINEAFEVIRGKAVPLEVA
jgi:hypothetical protein